jgi:proteasome activator subunit 4
MHDRSPVTNCLQPSIQKLVASLAQECMLHLNEEAAHVDAYVLETPRVDQALFDLESEFSSSFVDRNLLEKATEKSKARVIRRNVVYNNTVCTTTLFL